MMASQVIIGAFIIFIILRTYTSYAKKKLTKRFFLTWTTFWILSLGAILHPDLLSTIAKTVGIGRGVDLAVYLSIIIIFYLIYKIMVKQSNLDEKLTKLIRENAIKKK